MPSGVFDDGKLPVFVFPQSLTFYLEDQETHKRILTIYNPYDFSVRFKVFCTARDKYVVVSPDGFIKPKCRVDIIVRRSEIKPAYCNVTDKFRIQMFDQTTRQVIGERDITATLLSGFPDDLSNERDDFEVLPPQSSVHSPQSYNVGNQIQGTTRGSGANCMVILIGLVCVVALFMPNEGETHAFIPIQISLNMKLVFSYVLGLVTMEIFRA